jgi:hypothetical protein
MKKTMMKTMIMMNKDGHENVAPAGVVFVFVVISYDLLWHDGFETIPT